MMMQVKIMLLVVIGQIAASQLQVDLLSIKQKE